MIRVLQLCLILDLLVLFFAPASLAITPSSPVLINEIALKSSPDWIELYVAMDSDLTGIRIYEGASTLLKEIPNLNAQTGDYIILHFAGDPLQDETDITGRGANGYWDLYTDDAGLIATDDLVRLQQPGTLSVDATNTLDAVIWSNQDGQFTASQTTANTLVGANHWNEADFTVSDNSAWTDTDNVLSEQSLGRDQIPTDTQTAADWSIFEISTPGQANLYITPTSIATPTSTPFPTPSISSGPVPTPTATTGPTPTQTPTPTSAPTPTQIPTIISFTLPTSIILGQPFNLNGQIQHALTNQTYFLKFEASFDGETWYSGKTGDANQQYLAWNASWTKFPTVITNSDGTANFDLNAKIDSSTSDTQYQVRIKIKPNDYDQTQTSSAQSTSIVIHTPTPTVAVSPAQIDSDDTSTEDPNTPEDLLFSLIADAREQEIGTLVKVEGVVTAPPELLGSRVMYIEDESGGIKILLDRKDRNDLFYQDLVAVTGQVGESFNETYLKISAAEDVVVIGRGDLPEPIIIQTGLINETTEGRLVQINGQIVATSGNTFYVDDGSGEIKVYLKESTEVDKPKMRTGDYSQITGINSQYKDEWRILPRFLKDLIVSTLPILAESNSDQVLGIQTLAASEDESSLEGDIAELPQTGYSQGDIGLFLLWLGFLIKKLTPAIADHRRG